MKRILSLAIIFTVLFSLTVTAGAVHVYPDYTPPEHPNSWDGYIGYQPSADLAKIIHDYDIITEDPRDVFAALFNIKKSDVLFLKEPLSVDNIGFIEYLVVSAPKDLKTAEEITKFICDSDLFDGYSEGRDVIIYYYNFDGSNRIENADVKMYTFPWSGYLDDYNCIMQIYISNEGMKHLDIKLSELLDTINTPEMLFDVCGVEIPEEYYTPELYHSPVKVVEPFGYVIENYFWELFGAGSGSYNQLTKRMRLGFIEDSIAIDSVYLTDPWCAKILRAFNPQFYRYGADPIYGYKFKEDEGCQRIEMTVNYVEPEGVAEGDYLSYTVDNIGIEIVIENKAADKSPQTGTPIVPLAITATASLLLTAVLKKRKV